MAKPNDEDVLEFSVAVEIRESLKAMEKFARSMKKTMKEVAASSRRVGAEGEKANRKNQRSTEDWRDAVEKLNESYEYHDKVLKARGDTLRELRSLYEKADKEAKKNLVSQIELLEKNYKLQLKSAKVAKTTQTKGGLGARMLAPGLRRAIADIKAPGGLKKALEDAGEKLKAPLDAFLRKDAQGLAEKAARGFSAAVGRSFHAGRLFTRLGARAMNARGSRAIMAGKATGGVKGALQQAGGGGMKVVGDLLGSVGKLMRPLAALGPLLSGALIGLVKVFLDLDAEVREFNKSLLDSTSNLEFLGRAGGNVEAAVMDMGDALDGARKAALDFKFNNALGITKDTHVAILNTLNQEGVALGMLSNEAGNTMEGMKAMTQSIVQMGVAYSRGLGVPLQEISTFQAEMMTEMGRSVDDTRQSFAMLARSAQDSGMAGSKFFQIIRGLSTDLGLFNLRLEDSAAILTKISKVMSPRNAQKFMQQAAQGLKQMGRQDKLRLSLFAGKENSKRIVEDDIKRKTTLLARKIAQKTGEDEAAVAKTLRDQGYAGVKDALAQKFSGPEGGALAESVIDLQLQMSRAKKGTYGIAQAFGDLDLGAALQVQRDALMSKEFGGKRYGSLASAAGSMDVETVADALGMSPEQLDMFAKAEIAAEAQREALKNAPNADAAAVERMGFGDLLASMPEEMKKAMGVDADARSMEQKMYDLSSAQGQKTQSYQEKLSNFVDWVMNTLYDLFVDIYDAIMSLPGMGGAKGKREVLKSRNQELIRAYDASSRDGNLDFGSLKGRLLGEGGGLGKQLTGLAGTAEGRQRIAGSVQQNLSGHEIVKMATQSGLDPKKLAELTKKLQTMAAVTVDPMTGMAQQQQVMVGKGEAGDLMKIFEELKLTAEEQRKLLEKAGWATGDLEGFTALVKDLGTAGGVPVAGAGPASSPVADGAEAAADTSAHLETVVSDNQKTQGILKQEGIKIAPATLKEEGKELEKSMLSALRTALFEFYLYSATDRGTMLAAMESGGVTDPREVAQRFREKAVETGSTLGSIEDLAKPRQMPANAAGGMVTGIGNGMAMVAAHGEGLASVGRGERIVPAGGGASSGVSVIVNGIGGQALARLIEGKVVEGIREYKRRERLY